MEAALAPIYEFLGNFYEPMFMRRAALALLLLSLGSAGAGVLVVNRRMAFFSDAVSHSVFAGLALALVFSLPEEAAVLVFGLFIGLLVIWLGRHSRLGADSVIGLVFSGAVALGLAVVSRNPAAAKGLSRFFLGDVLMVGDAEIWALAGLDVLALVFLALFFNHLTLDALSPSVAQSRSAFLSRVSNYAFGAFLALVVVVTVSAVGVLLVTALLVAPAATGRVCARSAGRMFWIAAAVSAVSGQIGLFLSAQPAINSATGATVVLTAIVIFVAAYVWKILAARFTAKPLT